MFPRIIPPSPVCWKGEGIHCGEVGIHDSNKLLCPPSWSLAEFDSLLERVGDIVRDIPPASPLIVAGDFNAKSPAWGESRQDVRGTTLVEWVNSLDLHIFNEGRASTCIRLQGSPSLI